MDFIELGIFAITVVFSLGVWVMSIRVLQKRVGRLEDHNAFQDRQIAATHTTSQVILANLEAIKSSLEELKIEHREQIRCMLKND